MLEFYYVMENGSKDELARVFNLNVETSTLTSDEGDSLEGVLLEDGSIIWSDKNESVNAIWTKEGFIL